MEKNVDKIKRLEHELGRFRKKITDQARELDSLRKQLRQAEAGSWEVQLLMDAVLTVATLRYGERVSDPDTPKEVLGWRLELPCFSARELRKKYELCARKDEEKDVYVLGVVERCDGSEEVRVDPSDR